MTDWGKLLSESEIANAKRERKKTYLEKTIFRSSLEDEKGEGWSYYSETKNEKKVKVRKEKSLDEVFENKVWVLFASMGFNKLNRDRHFEISYSEQGKASQKQIDVFAADEETVLVIECKCAISKQDSTKSWKTELEAINGYENGVRAEIRKQFPDHKVSFIFATNGYIVGEKDKERMDDFGIIHFDEKTISYYEELTNHLGSSARYQLLGALFAGQKIANMDNEVPAIQGKMGGHTYYAFSIKPEILLKIGYVLHRSEANGGLMPTYQRIIKKNRIKDIHAFIEKGGFFPNSIIINIDRKTLQFDLADKQKKDSVSKIGILHLPNQYRSAYIIDGQHRLYGYSDTRFSETNSIPVVAFLDMSQKEQVQMFMDINENQKSVSKNLRNTLTSDLLWYSEDENEKRKALRSKIAQDLGDKPESPLFDRVIIGEDQATERKCITMDSIINAIESTNMLSKFSANNVTEILGVFDQNDNDSTIKLIEKYIFGCFEYLKEKLPQEWDCDPKSEGILLFNNGIGGLIRLFGNIADELKEENDPKSIKGFLDNINYYLDPVVEWVSNLSDEEKSELRSNYGGNGPKHFWRNLQRAVHNSHPSFNPDGYEKYWEDHNKSNNEEAGRIMKDAESIVRSYIKKCITDNCEAFGGKMVNEIPESVYKSAIAEAIKVEYKTGERQDLWDYIYMGGLQKIAVYGKHWTTLFEKDLTLPSEIKKAGGKEAKTDWMKEIDNLQRKIGRSNFYVSKEQFDELKEVEQILPNLANKAK